MDTSQQSFSASGPPPAASEATQVTAGASAEERLMAAIGEIDELVARAAETEPEELDPVVVALLERFTGPDSALESQSLRRRVEAGTLTWPEFWRAPYDHPGGVALWSRVQQARTKVALTRLTKPRNGTTTTTTSETTTREKP